MQMYGSGGNDPAIVFPDVNIDKVAEVAFYAFLSRVRYAFSFSSPFLYQRYEY